MQSSCYFPCTPQIKLQTLSQFKFQLKEKPTTLPIVIRQSGCGSVYRYLWDQNHLKLVSVPGTGTTSSSTPRHNFQHGFAMCGSVVRNFFLPQKFTPNYLEYVKWKFLHRLFSSALQVLATQAMLRAIGIGDSRSLPSAAALNWVLKDGLGRLSRCIYTASLASAFDTNMKRVRFMTSVMFSLSIGVELLTPAFPQYFLLLASLANIAKQISLACYLATGSAVHRSFAISDNIGEVSAKSQIQTMCFDNLGLMVAASLNIFLRNNQRLQAGLPFVIYPIFTAIDLFGIYQGLKHVHLHTLTKDRLEIIINTWIQLGYVPSPAEVSKEEGIEFLWSKGKDWPIRIGCLNPKSHIPKLSMMTMRYLNDDHLYFVCIEIFSRGLTKTGHQGILLCLREEADTADVIMGLLQASYIRRSLLLSRSKWEDILDFGDNSDSGVREWCKLIEDTNHSARDNLNLLKESMLGLGWACKNILLGKHEQARYGFVDD